MTDNPLFDIAGYVSLAEALGLRGPGALPRFLSRGACKGEEPEIFDGEEGATSEVIAQAKSICAACPVRSECLEYALAEEPLGIWGGATAEEREAMQGGATPIDPYKRAKAQKLKDLDEAGDITASQIAEAFECSTRTVFRWRGRRAS